MERLGTRISQCIAEVAANSPLEPPVVNCGIVVDFAATDVKNFGLENLAPPLQLSPHHPPLMPLEEIEITLPSPAADVPTAVADWIAESDRRIDGFFHAERNRKLPKYLPSDPDLLFTVLQKITEDDLPLGRVYCEWGSGFGVGTGIAALLGYEAWGIEWEDELVEIAEKLANDQGVDANFLATSYLPEGYESAEGVGGEILIRDAVFTHPDDGAGRVGEIGYEGMERELSEVDVFYVYPWPYQQEFMHQLFDELAVEGALLITYLGSGEISVWRKVAGDEDKGDDDDEGEFWAD